MAKTPDKITAEISLPRYVACVELVWNNPEENLYEYETDNQYTCRLVSKGGTVVTGTGYDFERAIAQALEKWEQR